MQHPSLVEGRFQANEKELQDTAKVYFAKDAVAFLM